MTPSPPSDFEPYYLALTAALAALTAADPDLARDAAATRDDNAPVPIDTAELDPLMVLSRVLDLAQKPLAARLLALVQLCPSPVADPAQSDRTVVAFSQAALSPSRGVRHSFAQLAAAMKSRVPCTLTDPVEATLLAREVAAGSLGPLALHVVALPTPPSAGAEDEDPRWALTVFSPKPQLSPAESSFLGSFAQLLALSILGKRLDDSLRERTRRLRVSSSSPYIADGTSQGIEIYRELFQSSADGVIVIDEHADVIWLNRSAEEMTGYASAGLAGRGLHPLLLESQQPQFAYACGLVLSQHSVPTYDLSLRSTSQEQLVLSVSTSAILSPQPFIILSFRDVTEKRHLETELRETKEFLESLINSTVDGIIAADVTGKIVLFNQGAARILGYSPDEVIGRLPVWELYPPGDAHRVMAELRALRSEGGARLSQSRKIVIGKGRVEVPVALSAAIIFRAGEEVATVGVMTDLRERIDMEKKLEHTERRLAESEKQAVVVELAGAMAHELNQPLTSIIGYSQLIRRLLPEGLPNISEFAKTLERESDRMAEIVRNIGHITRYETQSYVGETRIVDLGRSAAWPTAPVESEPRQAGDTDGAASALEPLFERLGRDR